MKSPGPAGPIEEPSAGRLWESLMRLAEFVEPNQEGWTRRVFSPAYRDSRSLVAELMQAAGLVVTSDPAANLIGRLPGSDPAAPALVLGSHTDTVCGGGRFDGMVGVVAAIEVAHLLARSGQRLRHPLWVVDFLGEEPNGFGLSCLGSRAVTGHLTDAHLTLLNDDGASLRQALAKAGSQPDRLAAAVWPPGALHAYLELHIEQGARLERAGRSLGVVTAIAGISRARIELGGRADHAGTTPMDQRLDALQAAAEIILGTDAIGRHPGDPDGVATAGRVTVGPNAPNVVPARAELLVELRSIDRSWLQERAAEVEQLVERVGRQRGVTATLEWVSAEPPVRCDPRVRALLSRVVSTMGGQPLEVPSGASHDAAHLARLAPMGMLFIPSRGGRSHCPEEWSEPQDVARGAAALLLAVRAVDGANF